VRRATLVLAAACAVAAGACGDRRLVSLRAATPTAIDAGGEAPPSGACPDELVGYGVGTVGGLGGEHVTADQTGTLFGSPGNVGSLTNSILTGVTNFGGVTFYNCATNSSSTGFYQTAGSGAYYLADNSPYRNSGTTNISPGLLSDLSAKTTYPPIVTTFQVITNDWTLFPQAQRDNDAIDLGFHYDPIDFAFQQVVIRNATFSVLPGTVVCAGGVYGLGVQAGGKFICQGTPTNLNRMVFYNMVQEHSTTNWDYPGNFMDGDWLGGTPQAEVSFKFTDWSMPPGIDSCHFVTQSKNMLMSFSDCQFHSGSFYIGNASSYLTNNLFERVITYFDDSGMGVDIYPIVRNCTFFGGLVNLTHWNADTWFFRDNLFDHAAITQDGQLDHDYDGYVTGSARLTNSAPHDIVTNLTWQTGPLGKYYQPTNSSFLNAGSVTNASLVGLYHYTVTTNLLNGLQIKETNSVVDIGFHMVAVDSNGNPIDTNADGIPDYMSDLNGNGLVDSGEIGWNITGDLGLKVIITKPKANSNVP